MDNWLELLRAQVDDKGSAQVARELSISPTAISLVLHGRYGASTERIASRVTAIYGDPEGVPCPVLGYITPARCAAHHERAQTIRVAGNPRTIRLHATCRRCPLRGHGPAQPQPQGANNDTENG
jgi:hypothetical protein